MPIEFACPNCQTQIRVDQAAAGKMARCPKCQGICRVPDSSTPPISSLGSPFDPLPSNSPSNSPAPKANPFSDANQAASSGGPLNPYASPTYVSSPLEQGPLTDAEVRIKLLGPAIGLVIGGFLSLGYVGLTVLGLSVNPNQGIPADDRLVFVILLMVAMTLPSLAMLAGSVAMFRGKGVLLAWTGAIGALIPCNPCCLISLGFGIWGIVMLCDPRVTQAMRS